MKKTTLVIPLLVLVLGGIPAQERLNVAAAANISSLAPELGSAFAATYPAYRVDFTFGASGTLVTQILHGSPARVFLSADLGFAQKIVDAGEAAGPVRTYAYGKLILLSTHRLDFSKGLAVLEDPSLVRVAIANPETAPYGKAAMQALGAAGILERVKDRLVMAQDISQTLQFTLTGAEAGFVNKSVLRSAAIKAYDKEGIYWIAIDPALYSPIAQGFVLTKAAAADPAALAFADFLLSPEAGDIFSSFGYGRP
ncbi:MAG TPA: molybdate ABC transporter substrate-binding protein [Rectinemataceae bacterium]|nr:molybdate ABC transporter substrate-binding protein [Rectinemataceae bacterium]